MSQGFDIKTANLKSKKGFFKVGSLTFLFF